MEIIWLGKSCFRLQSGALRILADPFDLPPGAAPLEADIVTISSRAARDRLAVQGRFRLVDGPGEYEIKGIPVTGIATAGSAVEGGGDGRPPRNFVYSVTLDGVSVCHLGRLSQPPASHELQEIGAPDVLLLPLGEPEGLPAQRAAQLASQLEARLLVPMTLGGREDGAALERFCKELGADPSNFERRLTVTSSGLPAQARVALLAAQALPAPT